VVAQSFRDRGGTLGARGAGARYGWIRDAPIRRPTRAGGVGPDDDLPTIDDAFCDTIPDTLADAKPDPVGNAHANAKPRTDGAAQDATTGAAARPAADGAAESLVHTDV
jgi:hypothetical protein